MPQFYFQGIEPIPKLPFQMLSTHLHLALTQDADLYGIGDQAPMPLASSWVQPIGVSVDN